MKREIKFRGKRYGDGDWVYGNLYQGTTDGEQYSIILNDAGYHIAPQDDRNLAIAFAENEVNVVFIQTVGQFTGLLDKNGKEIYEGDIMRIPETEFNIEIIGVVEFDRGSYVVRSFFSGTHSSLAWAIRERQPGEQRGVVIGNIHDNPELLKTETL